LITAIDTDIAQSTPEAACQYLDNQGIWATEGVFKAFKSLDLVRLLVPVMLHTIYLDILKHPMDWTIPFLQLHHQMDGLN
jgi:hypothetical protein